MSTPPPVPDPGGADLGDPDPGRPGAVDPGPDHGDPILVVQDLVVDYDVGGGLGGKTRTLRAVDHVNLALSAGRTLGVVGESGCGKSSLGRAIVGLVPLASGRVALDGVDMATLDRRALRAVRRQIQMVFQDPFSSLNPRQSVGRAIAEPIRAHKLWPGDQVDARVRQMLDQVGLAASAARRYPHEFSGGQRQRIGLARALALQPQVLVVDEPVSALDVSVQAQILNLLLDLQEELGLAYLFISHDVGVVRHMSDDVSVMYLGRVVENGTATTVADNPSHPYTRALLSAVPEPDPVTERQRERVVLTGDAPRATELHAGCAFVARCPAAHDDRCSDERPVLRPMPTGAVAACHWAEEWLEPGVCDGEPGVSTGGGGCDA